MPSPDTRVLTAHVPAQLASQVERIAARLDRSRGWVVKQALAAWVHREEERQRLTLEALIGRGGMGIVFEAEQESLGRRVALKILPDYALLDKRLQERFRREAQAAARLQHPHIVKILHLDEQDPPRYFAMELVVGLSLEEKIKKAGFLSPEPATLSR